MPSVSLDPDLTSLAAPAVYLVVLGFVFVESGLLVGFFLPGDTVLFAAGLLAGDPHSGLSLPLLVAGVLVAAVSGDAVGYALGARAGRPYLERRMRRGRLDGRHLARAEGFYAAYGWWAVFAARWIPWVRTFVPVLAGVSRMPYARFASANAVGAVTWGAGLLLLGRAAADHPVLRNVAYAVAGCFVLASLVAGGTAWWRRRRADALDRPR